MRSDLRWLIRYSTFRGLREDKLAEEVVLESREEAVSEGHHAGAKRGL